MKIMKKKEKWVKIQEYSWKWKTEEKEGVNDEKYDYWRKLAGKKEIVVIMREEFDWDNIT